jgi:hypothetical protein
MTSVIGCPVSRKHPFTPFLFPTALAPRTPESTPLAWSLHSLSLYPRHSLPLTHSFPCTISHPPPTHLSTRTVRTLHALNSPLTCVTTYPPTHTTPQTPKAPHSHTTPHTPVTQHITRPSHNTSGEGEAREGRRQAGQGAGQTGGCKRQAGGTEGEAGCVRRQAAD